MFQNDSHRENLLQIQGIVYMNGAIAPEQGLYCEDDMAEIHCLFCDFNPHLIDDTSVRRVLLLTAFNPIATVVAKITGDRNLQFWPQIPHSRMEHKAKGKR